MKKFMVIFLIIIGILIFGFSLNHSARLSVIDGGETQRTWQDANAFCASNNSRLPSIFEMLGIYYGRNDINFDGNTDYWSTSHFFNYAFGVATRFGILSFDRFDDKDHFICIADNPKN